MLRKTSLILFTGLLFASCSQDFERGEKGLEYKIISDGKGATIKNGNFMQMHIAQIIQLKNGKDSVLSDTRTGLGPAFDLFDSSNVPPEYYKIVKKLRKGDSLTIRILNDTLMNRNKGNMPAFFTKGKYFFTTVKLLDIYKNEADANAARTEEMSKIRKKDSIESIAIMAKDDKTLQQYFKKNNIKVQKAPKGTYVEILQRGDGAPVDTSVVAVVNYTGKTMDGKVFDSNTDPTFEHNEPFQVNMTNDSYLGAQVIKGWTDGMLLMNKGAKAKFYIPSPLAYGKNGAGEKIKPNSILIFDIEVIDLLSKEKVKADLENKRKEFMAKQKRFTDSLEQVQRLDSIKNATKKDK